MKLLENAFVVKGQHGYLLRKGSSSADVYMQVDNCCYTKVGYVTEIPRDGGVYLVTEIDSRFPAISEKYSAIKVGDTVYLLRSSEYGLAVVKVSRKTVCVVTAKIAHYGDCKCFLYSGPGELLAVQIEPNIWWAVDGSTLIGSSQDVIQALQKGKRRLPRVHQLFPLIFRTARSIIQTWIQKKFFFRRSW